MKYYMKKIHDLTEYKKARIIVEELSFLLEELKDIEVILYRYLKYGRVKELVSLIDETKRDFKRHIKANKEKLNPKGL